MTKLSTLKINAIKQAGMYADGQGLYLKVQSQKNSDSLSKSWMFRWGAGGKKYMGLGSFSDVPLVKARELAAEHRKLLNQGLDPKIEKEKRIAQKKLSEESAITFKEAAEKYIEMKKASWTNPKHAQQFYNTLNEYAFPSIGSVICSEVTKDHVFNILNAIWLDKHETATRLRGRIENVLDWAKSKGFVQGENVAVWKGNMKHQLPLISKKVRVKHHESMDYELLPKFIAEIKDQPFLSAKALILCILTATRTIETIGAYKNEFDLKKGQWDIPPERMKLKIAHRVPLSRQAIELLESLKRDEEGFLFSSNTSQNGYISNMTMLNYLHGKKGCENLTVHGFRSTFKVWATEKTNHPHEVSEHALAHSTGNKVVDAYQRGTIYEKRAQLMQDWADYCYGFNPEVHTP